MAKVKKTEKIPFAELEKDLKILAKWGGIDKISDVVGILNAMLDTGLSDIDLELPKLARTRTGTQYTKAKENHTRQIWEKVRPNYKGSLIGNQYYGTVLHIIHRQNSHQDYILQKFKPYKSRKFDIALADQYLVKITVVRLDAKGKPDKTQKPQTKQLKGKAHDVVFGSSNFVASIAVSDSSDLPGIIK